MSSQRTRLRIDSPDELNEFLESRPMSGLSFLDDICEPLTPAGHSASVDGRPLVFPMTSAPDDFDNELDSMIRVNRACPAQRSETPSSPSRMGAASILQRQTRELLQIVGAEFRRISQQFDGDALVTEFCQRLKQLSSREVDALLLSIQGKSCKELAQHLDVGIATAAKHRAGAFRKLHVRNSTELLFLLKAIFSQGGLNPLDTCGDALDSRFADRAVERIG